MGHVRMGTTEDMSVGVMRDENLKLRDLYTSHTLGCANQDYPPPTDQRVRMHIFFWFYFSFIIIGNARAKENTYRWVSV